MALTDRMKEARKKQGFTQEQVATKIGVAKSTYTGYEKGYSEPNMIILSKIMDVLSVDANYLFQDEAKAMRDVRATPQEMENLVKKYRLLDPYGKEAVDGVLDVESRRCEEVRQKQAAVLRDKREQVEIAAEIAPVVILHQPYAQVAAAEGAGAFLLDDGCDEVTVEMNKYTKQADVILKVVGRSMEPVIADGDRVLIRMQPSVKIGEIGVFIIDGQGYLKEYQADKLVSLNPAIEDIYIGDLQCAECYGKFIEVLKPDWVK